MRISRPYITDIKSDLIPDASGIRDIGSSSLAFAKGHFDDIYISNESLHLGTDATVTAPSGIMTFNDIQSGPKTLSDLSASGGGGLEWGVISSNANAEDGKGYLIDASSGNVTLTLPVTPSEGDTVGVSDYTKSATTNTITIARNGSTIEGSATDLVVDIDGAGFTLVYTDATEGWKIVTEISGGGSLPGVDMYSEAGGAGIEDAIPQMTSNTAPSPYVISTDISVLVGNEPYKAFDNNVTPRQLNEGPFRDGAHQGYNHYVRVDVGVSTGVICRGFTITACGNGGTYVPPDWRLEGSFDATNWITLDRQAGQIFANSEKKSYTFNNASSYRYYQWYWTANPSSGNEAAVDQMEWIGIDSTVIVKFKDAAGRVTTTG